MDAVALDVIIVRQVSQIDQDSVSRFPNYQNMFHNMLINELSFDARRT